MGAAGTGVARDVDAVDPESGDLGDKCAQGGLVEVGEPTPVAHAVVGAQLEAEVEGAAGPEDP